MKDFILAFLLFTLLVVLVMVGITATHVGLSAALGLSIAIPFIVIALGLVASTE